MKKILIKAIMIMGLAVATQAQTWTTTNAPVTVTIDGLRIDFIGLTITTNLTASGIMAVSKMSGSNAISRSTIPLPPKALTSILANCGGITLAQLGNLILGAGGMVPNSEFISKLEIFIDARTGKSKLTATTLSGKKKIIEQDVVNAAMVQAGGSVTIFQNAFLAYAKANVK